MREVIKHLAKAIRLLNEEYPYEIGTPKFAINNRSYDPITMAATKYKTDYYLGKLKQGQLHPWHDFGLLTEQLDPLLKTLSEENRFFYIREFKQISPIITIFDALDYTYERYYIENEREFYENRFYDSFIEKNNLIKNITNETSEDPIFTTLTIYYEFKPKK